MVTRRTVSVCATPPLSVGHVSHTLEAAPNSQHIKALGCPYCGTGEDASLPFGLHCVRSVLRQFCLSPKSVRQFREILVLLIAFFLLRIPTCTKGGVWEEVCLVWIMVVSESLFSSDLRGQSCILGSPDKGTPSTWQTHSDMPENTAMDEAQ